MSTVEIDASPKQLSRLRNGHRVRIKKAMKGMGVNLIVDPSKFDPISRSFAKGAAYQIQLSPDEIMANKQAVADGEIEGQGIFASGGAMTYKTKSISSLKDLKSEASKLKGKAKEGVSKLKSKAMEMKMKKSQELKDKAAKLRKQAEQYEIQGSVTIAKKMREEAAQAEAEAGVYMEEAMAEADASVGGKLKIGKAFKKIGSAFKSAGEQTLEGLKSAEQAARENPYSRAVIKTAVPMIAEKGLEVGVAGLTGNPFLGKLAGKSGAAATKEGLSQAGYGLYVGRGMYAGTGMCGGMLPGPRSRMPEGSSIGIGGNLLSSSEAMQNPALRSDPMGANFAMNTQLPPQYQRGGIRFV